MFSKLIRNARARKFLGLLILLMLMLWSFTLPNNSWAQGRMLIKPYLNAGWEYDDNYHRSDTNEKEVHTYFIQPGLEFGYTTDKTLVSLDYYADVQRYDDQDDYLPGESTAEDHDYVGHSFDFTAQAQITRRLLIGVDDLFLKTRDPANADRNSNAVDRFKYYLNSFSPRMVYNFGDKLGVSLKYTNLLTDYINDDVNEGEDSLENRGTLKFFYYFTPKTSLDLDYQYWTRDYDKTTSDYDSQQLMVNFNKQFNVFTFSAGAGYHQRDFDKAVPNGDIDRFVWQLAVLGENPPKGEGPVRTSMYLAVGSNLNDSGSGETYYESTRLDFSLSHLFMRKINCTLAGWFQNSDYETSDREDDRWLASLAVDYLINDYLSAGIEGGYEERDSSEANLDFEKQYLMFNIRCNYDLGSR